jgi:hypothetical protein
VRGHVVVVGGGQWGNKTLPFFVWSSSSFFSLSFSF